MAAPRLEDLFATFRATRDPRSLAAIFDATASELLLIAVHLVGDRAEAEDLVQGTLRLCRGILANARMPRHRRDPYPTRLHCGKAAVQAVLSFSGSWR